MMASAEFADTDLTSQINQKLGASSRRRFYAVVKVLIIYWQDGDAGFRTEGEALGALLKRVYGYDVLPFSIPTARSQQRLQNIIENLVFELEESAFNKDESTLLIIHYGGHGDPNDDRKAGELQQSVWAAHASGEPSLNWYEVQILLKRTSVDVLLLLDCCFAAQAARSRDAGSGKFELLAAAAMGMKTPGYGSRSFTSALMKLLEESCVNGEVISVVDLHRRLIEKEVNLYATPVYVALNPSSTPIRLKPLATGLDILRDQNFQEGSRFEVLIDVVQPLDHGFVNNIVSWLGKAAPPGINAIEVKRRGKDVLDVTACIQDFVHTDLEKGGTLTHSLPDVAHEDIRQAWKTLAALLNSYKIARSNKQVNNEDTSFIARELITFIDNLEATNSAFADLLGRWILNSAAARDPESLDDLIQNQMTEKLHLTDQLQLRRAICSPDQERSSTHSRTQATESQDRIQEYRDYGAYIDPAQLPELRRRIASLADLLSRPKDDHFLCLPCCNWYEETHRHRFVLNFSIPQHYKVSSTRYWTLYDTILKSRGLNRPSLDERFVIASKLARAVQKWHSVGWVHQGINSHNVVFLFHSLERLAFARPVLLGFQYSRPESTPSIGWALDDIPAAIYRHPERQRHDRRGHTKVHDIYSLGVVLLEIGLWQTGTDVVMLKKMNAEDVTADALRARLISACETRLGHYAGTAYQEAVNACLQSDFAVTVDDAQDTNLVTAFQQKVVARLSAGIET